MGTRYLNEHEVAELLSMREAIELVEEAFRRWAAGEAHNVPRHRAHAPGFVLHTMSAAAEFLQMAACKVYTTTHHGARFHVALYDQQTGTLLALMAANKLGQMRTGAVSAVATRCLAPPQIKTMGIFGTGWQAEAQVEALACVLPLHKVFCYSRREENRVRFAAEMSRRLELEVLPVDRPLEAAEDLPVVVTATNSREPVFHGDWLADGAHVCAVGVNWLDRAEIDVTTIRRADHIVCDQVEACRHEAGDFLPAIEAGVFDWSQAVNLADVLTGRAVGRGKADNLTLFKSVGLALEDLALAAEVYRRAIRQHVGRELALH